MSDFKMAELYRKYESEKEHEEEIFYSEQQNRQREAVNKGIDHLVKDYSFNLDQQELLFSLKLAYVFEQQLEKGRSLNQVLVKVESRGTQIKALLLFRNEKKIDAVEKEEISA